MRYIRGVQFDSTLKNDREKLMMTSGTQQAHDVIMTPILTSMQCDDVASTSIRSHNDAMCLLGICIWYRYNLCLGRYAV